jgi:acetyl esterase/lipase
MDLSDPFPLIKILLPKTPVIGKAALYHTLGISETSKKWTLKTELTVSVLRSFLMTPTDSIAKSQHISLKDPGIKGRMWISKVTLPKPKEDDVRQALFEAIENLKAPDEAPGGFTQPELVPVEAEWTGYRSGVAKDAPELRMPEDQKYIELMKEAASPTTVLYFHGGAHYLLDPASHRPTTVKLAKLTKGRCLSVRYRLAPQNPFPAALLDALVSYLTLLYPSPGSYHTAVEARHIVFAGDSAGGNLSMALLQLLLEFHNQKITIRWNGTERTVPLPAGVACNSPWLDITSSSPSYDNNRHFDYLPPVSAHPEGVEFPPCDIWPAKPPRKNIYAEDAVCCHPLVSPLAAKSWEGAPPMWIETGQELLSDEDKHVAMVAARQGVTVVYEEFEAMPHCFAMILGGIAESRKCFDSWSSFITAAVEQPESLATRGVRHQAKTLEEEALDVQTLSPYTEEEVHRRMKDRAAKLLKFPNSLAKL